MTTDFDANDNGSEEEDFATLFESYQDVIQEDLRMGDQVTGQIISIGRDTVFVDIGRKIDGVVDKAELLDEKGQISCRESESIELYVVAVSENEIRLSKALSGIGGLHILQDAYANEVPVEGKVTQTCKGGVNVEILHRKAFCPVSQMDLEYVETTADYVGKTGRFLITQIEDGGKNIVVSRKKLLQRERAQAAREFIENLTVGSVLDGRVKRLVPYGVFVELAAGVEGMVHISELSWSRLKDPAEAVSAGEVITVKIIDIQAGATPAEKKIALSVKQLQSDPWDTADDRFAIGQKVTGKVTKCVTFGAFVEIAPGIEGLVHISEMSYIKRVLKPEDVVSSDQTVSVVIKAIDADKQRISLSLRDAEGDPWLNVPEKYRIGQRIEGAIEKKESFGYFVTLEPGVTGLLPRVNIGKAAQPAMLEKLKEGEAVTVIVERLDAADRKITLTPADLAEEGDWKSFVKDSQASMSPLAEQLQQVLGTKDD